MTKLNARFLSAVLLSSLGVGLLWAQKPSPEQAAPDNTKINQRARDKAEPTADQQKDNESDREMAREIRRALVTDKSLSTKAHNVKVIAQNGKVTLKGPVESEQEKQTVEAKAAEMPGQVNVTSEIEVAPR
jgi:hyperosmotically inducible periplasmic protein